MMHNRKNVKSSVNLIQKLFIVAIMILLLLSNFTLVAGDNDNGNSNAYGHVKKGGKNNTPTFIYVNGYEPWAVKVTNAGNPDGVDLVTLDLDESSKILTITAQDSNTTNKATILVNKLFLDSYITNITDNIEFTVSEAVNFNGLDTSNESEEDPDVYVFHIKHFSTVRIIISSKGYLTPITSTTESPSLSFMGLLGILVAVTIVVVAAIYMFRQEKRRW
jgi:hypothetical protein